MRLLQVVPTVHPESGGPIEGIVQSARACQHWGCITHVLTLDSAESPWVHDFPLTVFPVGSGRPGFAYAPRLREWLERHARGYDAVIVHGLWQYQSLCAWRALRRSGPPYFVFPHGMLDPWGKRSHPWKYLKKSVYWLAVEHRVLRDARAVFFTAEQERLSAERTYWPFRAKSVVVPFGTTLPPDNPKVQRQAFRSLVPELGDRRYFLFLGRIHPKKGCDLLLEAFARVAADFPDIDVVVAGPDQIGWRRALRARAQALGVAQRVHWPGALTGDAKWGGIRGAAALVLPSHQENFAIVAAEAMACSVPVLITDRVNIWREVEKDGAGLVAQDTISGIEDLLARFLCQEPEANEAMRQRAKLCFDKRFDLRQSAAQLQEIMRELVHGGCAKGVVVHGICGREHGS